MKKIKKIIFIILLSTLSMASLLANFRINEYKININVQEDYVLNVSEDYIFEFDTERHGFYRVIPYQNYSDHNIKIKNLKVLGENYKTEKSGGFLTIRVGDPDVTVIGEVPYSIYYDYDIGSDNYEDFDEFYYNIIGNLWECEINNASFEITFPKPIDKEKVWLTIGKFDSTNVDNSIINFSSDLRTISGYINYLEKGEGVTIRAELEDGYFVGARNNKVIEKLMSIFLIVINIALIILAFIIFHKYGRDDKLIEQSTFDPPEGFTPLALGYFKYKYLTQKGYSSSFIYWAEKGYIDIVQGENDEVRLVRKVDFKIVKQDSKNYLDYIFFKAIFKYKEIGEEVNLEELDSESLGYELKKLKQEAERKFDFGLMSDKKAANMRILIILFALISSGISLLFTYTVSSTFMPLSLVSSFFFIVLSIILLSSTNTKWIMFKLIKKILIVLAVIILTLVNTFVIYLNNDLTYLIDPNINLVVSIVSAISLLLLILLFTFTEKRSEYAQDAIEKLLGYISFIKLVEVDQIEKMIEENPAFYFKHLSFALVLGLTKTWEKKFAKIEVPQPSWYICPVYGYYSINRINKVSSSLNKSLNVPLNEYAKNHSSSSSSSSGFSGSVGGGAGGGGGGAW
ncbi:MAG: DUF2207 domain-containing protein [Sphaerochaetaceae bacterium]|nr:DUF2207 domain-containing protein [Sphaerochaetaceae bacterium]